MIKRILTLILLVQLTSCATLNGSREVVGQLKNFGVIEIQDYGVEFNNSDATAGYSHELVKMKIANRTEFIELKQDITFGIEWCLDGITEDVVDFALATRHPKTTDSSGKVKTSSIAYFTGESKKGRFCSIDAYSLSESWELVEGDWVLSIIYNDQEIVKKKFVIKKS